MDEEDIDIEGDYTSDLGTAETTPLYFDNELPSTSVNLTPEFSQHPWMLEQGWANDYFMDEKSKATIEKMLLEEEGLIGDKVLSPKKAPARSNAASHAAPASDTSKSDEHLNHVEYEAILMDNDGVPCSDASFPNLLGANTTCVTSSEPTQEWDAAAELTIAQPPPPKPKKPKKTMKHGSSTHGSSTRAAKKPRVGRPRSRVHGGDKSTAVSRSETVNISSKTADEDEDVIVDIEADDDEDIAVNVWETPVAKSEFLQESSVSVETTVNNLITSENGEHANDLCIVKTDSDHKVTEPVVHVSELCMTDSQVDSTIPVDNPADTTCEQSELLVKQESPASNPDDDEDASSETDLSAYDEPDIKPDHWGVLTSKGAVVYLPNPESEVHITSKVVTVEEQEIHSEFFDGRPGLKTEERYLKIRNYIVDCWRICRPKYLYKTAVREGLKNCGDVNCIGRIHSYLEQKGAINFSCELAQYNCKRDPNPFKNRSKSKTDKVAVRWRSEPVPSRKRRVRGDNGKWINEADLEGHTIPHEPGERNVTQVTKRKRKPNADPFKLIPCRSFGESKEPFKVQIECTALVTMDIHSHLSKTEVIGLLGGEFHSTDAVLQVALAVPCQSVSTGMQCDMDPVSQAHACEVIHGRGQQVVGWYHSHPSFRPDPSLRDLETQTQYQTWFAQGGCPFIGVIINPFGSTVRHFNSEVRCLHIEGDSEGATGGDVTLAPDANNRVPFQFDFEVSTARWDSNELENKLCDLVKEYEHYSDRINIEQMYFAGMDHTVRQKMIYSALDYVKDDCGTKSEELHNILTSIFSPPKSPNS